MNGKVKQSFFVVQINESHDELGSNKNVRKRSKKYHDVSLSLICTTKFYTTY